MADVRIEESWKKVLAHTFQEPYFQSLVTFLREARQAGRIIYPPGSLIFNAFNSTPFEQVKVVILGQDPYHNPGEAMGLSFSVPRGQRIPPSLQNIYKELQRDLGIPPAAHGDLSSWAAQGVLLLNAMLTVEHNQPGSHQKIGWQDFTNEAIRQLSLQRSGLVFMLWGNFARSKASLIDASRHLILQAAHPSPFSVQGFLGCGHFSQANEWLQRQQLPPVAWALPA